MTPGLSVCCQVADPPARVAAVLQPLRDAATQVVVGVDYRIGDAELAPLRAIADEIVRLAPLTRPDELRTVLLARCTQPWIFSIDSDEVASPSLVRALHDLLAADGIMQYRIARHWCYPDLAHWLEETPWWPDFQTRLVRREVAAMAGPGPHDGLQAAEPARYIADPLYHLDCVVGSYATRAAKAGCYEALSPGRVPYGGGPFNETFYLPERFATLPIADTPPDDLAALEEVVAADPRSREEFLASLPAVAFDRDSVRRDAPLREAAYVAKLVVVERDRRFAPGEQRPLVVDVHNLGTATFPRGPEPVPDIRMTYRFRDRNGKLLVADGVRTFLPSPIAPGAHELVPVTVAAPVTPGRYLVEFDLVHEGVRWFDAPVVVDVVVADRWSRFGVTH